VTTDNALSGDFGDQLSLDQQVPLAGQLYKRGETGAIACVVMAGAGANPWISIRVSGENRGMRLTEFRRWYRRCRPDGTLL
jgi:hypothetical protein